MIAYYAHQHGSGHSNYAQIFAGKRPEKFIVFTSYPFSFKSEIRLVMLPDENPDGTEAPAHLVALPHYLHYSPVGQKSIQKRSTIMLSTCMREQVKLIIVDVSVEIAALARAASFPYAYVRLPGMRSDEPHLNAFRGAVSLLAYYPEAMEAPDVPSWIRNKTKYLGFFSRFDQKDTFKRSQKIKNVVVLSGNGGSALLEEMLPHVFSRFKHTDIDLFGDIKLVAPASHVHLHGYKQDILDYIEEADVVVANCGLNTISELLHLKKLILAIPEQRPYDEQEVLYTQLLKHQLVCSLTWALDATDQQILESTRDPSDFLFSDRLTEFVDKLVQVEHAWDLH